jgi:hypothetical protein
MYFRMDQRRESRIDGNQEAWITIYGKVDLRIPGRVRNMSGRGIGLEVGAPVGTGNALKIEIGDSMLLGEVIHCRPEGKRFYVGVELDQALHGLVALCETVQDFSAVPSGIEHAYATHDADSQDQQQSRQQDNRSVLLELPPH